MLVTVDKVRSLLGSSKGLVLAGDESVLRGLPRGPWIGGTIPYFMTEQGGTESRDRIFAVEVPAFATGARIVRYDEDTIARIGLDCPDNGYTILILPAFTPLHQKFALESPRFEQQFLKVLAGWIAGVHIDDLGKAKPKVFAGPDRDELEDKGVAIHIELPAAYEARIGIVNIFEPADGPAIQFLEAGFEATDCLVDGKRENVVDFFGRAGWDVRLPLISDYCGTRFNVSIQAMDIPGRKLKFFAPVLEGVDYRPAKPIESYADRFLAAVPADAGQSVFSCNCVLNYLHGRLKGRKTGSLHGPMTFGEIAYQLLNQTLVHISACKRQ